MSDFQNPGGLLFFTFLETPEKWNCDCYAVVTEIVIHNYAVGEFGRNCANSARFLFFSLQRDIKRKFSLL